MALLSTPGSTTSAEAALGWADSPDGSGPVLPRAEESRHAMPIAPARAMTIERTKCVAMPNADDV